MFVANAWIAVPFPACSVFLAFSLSISARRCDTRDVMIARGSRTRWMSLVRLVSVMASMVSQLLTRIVLTTVWELDRQRRVRRVVLILRQRCIFVEVTRGSQKTGEEIPRLLSLKRDVDKKLTKKGCLLKEHANILPRKWRTNAS